MNSNKPAWDLETIYQELIAEGQFTDTQEIEEEADPEALHLTPDEEELWLHMAAANRDEEAEFLMLEDEIGYDESVNPWRY